MWFVYCGVSVQFITNFLVNSAQNSLMKCQWKGVTQFQEH